MASGLFDSGREGFLDGSIDWDTDDIRVMLVKTGYVVDLAAHAFLDEVSTLFDNGRTAALGTKGVTAGVASAANTSLAAIAAVSSIALVVYKHNASDALARLIAWIEIAPFIPAAGQTVNITWDTGANKIFRL